MQLSPASRKKKLWIVRTAVLTLTIFCAVFVLSQSVFAKTTYVITDGDDVTIHTSFATNPAQVLDEAGFQLDTEDIFVTEPGNGISEITVQRGINLVIDLYGEKMSVVSYGETIAELIKRLELDVASDAIVSIPMNAVVSEGMVVRIYTTALSSSGYTTEIPFETVYQKTDLLKKGTEVILTPGVNGTKLITEEITYVNGDETKRVVVSEKVTAEPVTQVVAVGTGSGSNPVIGGTSGKPIIGDGVIITPDGQVLKYKGVQTFQATAYTHTDPGCNMITSTGTTVHIGTVAVDPRLVPYGTKMYIVSTDGRIVYGVSAAEDCGGDIKNNRIDLYYPTYEDCIKFGRRNCYVFFLSET